MSDLSIFYRILGIARHIIEPSYYHILGIDRKDCNSELVHQALKARKRELRENIPGPEFIPMVMKFEKEQLEPAAEVLVDDAKRHEYDRQLLKKQRQIEKKTRESANLIELTRTAVLNAVSSDGTLTPARRVTLAKELLALGVAQKNIDAILARIPLSEKGQDTTTGLNIEFFRDAIALEAAEGPLGPEQFSKLVKLGKRLGLPEKTIFSCIEDVAGDNILTRADEPAKHQDPSHATVSHLSDTEVTDLFFGSPAGDHPAPQNDPEDELVDIPLDPVPDTAEYPDPQEQTQDREWHEGIDLASVINFTVPIVCTVVLVALFGYLSSRDAADAAPENPAPVEQTRTPAQPVEQSPAEAVQHKDPAPNRPADPAQPEAPEQPSPQKSLAPSDELQFMSAQSGSFPTPAELMADAGMALMVCSHRADDFCDLPYEPNGLERLPLDENWAALAQRKMELELKNDDTAASNVTQAQLEELRRQISSSERAQRYRAIARLGEIASAEAVDILFDTNGQGFSGDRKTINARLRELKSIGSKDIAIRLADAIGETEQPLIAHQIWIALMDMTRLFPEQAGRLSPRNDSSQRSQCSHWWLRRLDDWQPPQGNPHSSEIVGGIDPRIESACQLLAFGAKSCLAVGSICERKTWTHNSTAATSRSLQIADPNSCTNVGRTAANQARFMTDQLGLMLRRHPDWQQFASSTEAVELDRQVAIACSRTHLQHFAVELRASARILAILGQLLDDKGEYNQALTEIARTRKSELTRAPDVLHEIRINALSNLKTWDLLLAIRKGDGQ